MNTVMSAWEVQEKLFEIIEEISGTEKVVIITKKVNQLRH